MSKQYLDACFYCGENKDAVRASQRPGGAHIICGVVDGCTGELLSEIKGGRHTFVVTEKDLRAQEEEAQALADHFAEMDKLYAADPFSEATT
ncbi:hypothetical protein [Dietzia sp. MNB45]|uniref:hypothetical protein n=1 Tax=Dietzia sp. MNB45 TaxID=3238800 RepID=UPI003F7FA0EB